MHYAIFNMYGNEIFKALAGEVVTFITTDYAFFFCAFPKSMTAIYASGRHSMGETTFAFLWK